MRVLMPGKMIISLCVDSSLSEYFAAAGHASDVDAKDSLVAFMASFLNDTRYPLAACRTGEREILLSYRLKAFADPIF